jgi:Ca2+-binding EF-hand superfamily protein
LRDSNSNVMSVHPQDLNQNGKINYTEFLAATIDAHGYIEEDRIAEAFDKLDIDGTGFSKFNLTK